MFCTKCGNRLRDDARFCNECGNEAATAQMELQAMPIFSEPVQDASGLPVSQAGMAIPAPVHQQQSSIMPSTSPLNNNLLSTVPYKGNGESVLFYDDHLEFDGNSLRYTDITVMDTYAVESTSYAAIVVYGDFDGYIRFTLANGQKTKIKVYGFSLYGIGAKGSAKRRFLPLFNAAYQIVAKAMAANALAQVRQGATINLAGIEITRENAVCKKLLKREPIYISKHNFGACGLDGYSVRVLDKGGGKLFATSDDNANALLLPYVLTTLFGD